MGKMSKEELEAWEKTRDLNAELLESIDAIQAGRATRRFTAESFPVLRAREKSGLSQAEFAALLGISRRTLEQWEQGRRRPSKAALMLIKVAERHPEILRELAA